MYIENILICFIRFITVKPENLRLAARMVLFKSYSGLSALLNPNKKSTGLYPNIRVLLQNVLPFNTS